MAEGNVVLDTTTKEQFEKKTVDEVSFYLKENGIDVTVCEIFEGKKYSSY